jgi:hypothetical protein
VDAPPQSKGELVVVYDNDVVVVVVMMCIVMVIMLVDDRVWFVSDNNFVSTQHGCECQKGCEDKNDFHYLYPRLSQWELVIPI